VIISSVEFFPIETWKTSPHLVKAYGRYLHYVRDTAGLGFTDRHIMPRIYTLYPLNN